MWCALLTCSVSLLANKAGAREKKENRTTARRFGEKNLREDGGEEASSSRRTSKCKRLFLRQATGEEEKEEEEEEEPGEASQNLTFLTKSPVCLPEFVMQNRNLRKREPIKANRNTRANPRCSEMSIRTSKKPVKKGRPSSGQNSREFFPCDFWFPTWGSGLRRSEPKQKAKNKNGQHFVLFYRRNNNQKQTQTKSTDSKPESRNHFQTKPKSERTPEGRK